MFLGKSGRENPIFMVTDTPDLLICLRESPKVEKNVSIENFFFLFNFIKIFILLVLGNFDMENSIFEVPDPLPLLVGL